MKRAKKGDIVQVNFLDHVEDGDEEMKFIVWGRVDLVTKRCLRIVSWAHEDPCSAPPCEPGTEKTFTIVRSAITSLKVLG